MSKIPYEHEEDDIEQARRRAPFYAPHYTNDVERYEAPTDKYVPPSTTLAIVCWVIIAIAVIVGWIYAH